MKFKFIVAALALAAGAAHADPFTVDAYANSSSGGTGLATINLTAGESFSVSASTDDLWNAGALPRFSDANGLTGNRYATASDDSGQSVGSLIGINFGNWTQDGFSAAYGSLVGRIGSGDYFLIGSSYNGIASTSGVLNLFYWDSNNYDNSGSVVATVAAVPEPETYALLLAGLGAVVFMARRRS